MKAGRIIELCLAGLLVLALGLPYWLPLGELVTRAEQLARKAVGREVAIGKIRVHLLPTPRLSMHDVRVGRPSIAEIPVILVIPEFFSLWSEVRVLRVMAESPEVQPEVFAMFRASPKKKGARKNTVEIRRMEITQATIRFPRSKVGNLGLAVDFLPGNAIQQAKLSHRGGQFEMTLTPLQDHYAVQASAAGWKLPLGPPVEITRLDVRGKASAAGFDVDQLTASLYGGTLTADATYQWKNGRHLAGHFKGERVALQPFLQALKSKARLEGQLKAEGQFAGQGPMGAALLEAMVINADFDIQEGVLRGVDLMGAVKGLLGGDAKGDTKFDLLKGHLEMGPAGMQYNDLYIESGALKAKGHVLVAKDKTLDGDISIDFKGTGSLIGAPELAISGTTEAPRLFPSKSAMAGAAIGTAVLGPGLGTTLGMKASGLAKKLFRPKPKKKEAPPDPAAPKSRQ
jgi:uncharacterized protein involved in outer membrane biogenesis